jgi:hypothetical protein
MKSPLPLLLVFLLLPVFYPADTGAAAPPLLVMLLPPLLPAATAVSLSDFCFSTLFPIFNFRFFCLLPQRGLGF